jgi:hypothetical protein
MLTRHSLELFYAGITPLGLASCLPSRQCPFIAIHLEAMVCDDITRSRHHLPEEGQFPGRADFMPEFNCNLRSSNLPRDVFLERTDEYMIQVTFSFTGFGEF